MPIPEFDQNGELPPGEHEATLDAIKKKFGSSTPRRIALMKGLTEAAANLAAAGVRRIWVNGSFITKKSDPNDIDGCWEYSPEVNIQKLDSVFLQQSRLPMKAKFGLDFLPTGIIETSSGMPFPKFFQLNRDGEPKGILVIKLGGAR